MNELVFWQNIISPHQSSIIKTLSSLPDIHVTLIVEKEFNIYRRKMGWARPDLGSARVIIAPAKEEILTFLNRNSKAFHIFSGTRGYPLIWFAFKHALKLKCKIGIMSEPGDWIGFKGSLRLLRSKLDAYLIKNKIKFILAIGGKGVDWFRKSGYSKERIFNWGYFIDIPLQKIEENKEEISDQNFFSIIYVGRLSKEKGVDLLINELSKISNLSFKLTIIGEGQELQLIKKLALKGNIQEKISLFNFMSNAEILQHIARADVLVLPSTGKDGWGVVVNEALLVGTPVISSSNCGAAALINDPIRGEVFDPNTDNLSRILEKRILNGKTKASERKSIKQWSEKISGISAAQYLLKVLNYSLSSETIKPNPPWFN